MWTKMFFNAKFSIINHFQGNINYPLDILLGLKYNKSENQI